MVSVKCHCCRKYSEFEYGDKERPGILCLSEETFDHREAWQTFETVCPKCGCEFSYNEIYRLEYFETYSATGFQKYTQKNAEDAAKRLGRK